LNGKQQLVAQLNQGFSNYAAVIALNLVIDLHENSAELREEIFDRYEKQIVGHRIAYEATKEDDPRKDLLHKLLRFAPGIDLKIYDDAIEESMAMIKQSLLL